ncbi:MAG: protein-export membrane protein SecF [Acidobacteriales bacterium 13_2_20CM_2_55_5]|nr:MAG: protein-export membrane protein SecF [Acidobacteriales bacterium 13_2_20CM_2_55_5]
MEFFRNPNIDFLGKKWYFLAFSLVFSVAGVLSMLFWHGIPLGVDFRGGTLVYVKFSHAPNDNAIRAAMDRAGLHNARIQRYGPATNNEVLIALEEKETSEQALDRGKLQIINALESNAPQGKLDLNNTSSLALTSYLLQKDPLHAGTDANQRYAAQAQAIVTYRDKTRGGVLSSFDELKGVADPAVIAALQEAFYLSDFGVRNVEIVGPQVGKQLQTQAKLAVLYSLAGMLVYLGFRFEWIYGVAAVITVFHDTLITVGAFSLANKEISLTVIAAILTLIGYSNNDTIVIFDRIRENLKLMRREKLADVVNKSINQTLSRTILTAGLTFLTVLALYLFGGEVLHGFSFALVIGILIGTYSSIAIAAPILVAYQDWRLKRKQGPMVAAGKESRRRAV